MNKISSALKVVFFFSALSCTTLATKPAIQPLPYRIPNVSPAMPPWMPPTVPPPSTEPPSAPPTVPKRPIRDPLYVIITSELSPKSPAMWIQCVGTEGDSNNLTVPGDGKYRWRFVPGEVPFGACMFGWDRKHQFFPVAGAYSACTPKDALLEKDNACHWNVRKDGFYYLGLNCLRKKYNWLVDN